VREEISRPFNISTDPVLCRALVLKLSAEEHLLVLTMHHIISDEWSVRIFFRELREFYGAFRENRAPTLPELPIQYADYALWQREWLQGEALDAQFGYWQRRLGKEPPALELPTIRPRLSVQSYRGAAHRHAAQQPAALPGGERDA